MLIPLVAAGSMRQDELLVAVAALVALALALTGLDRVLPLALALLGGCVLLGVGHGDTGKVAVVLAAGLLLLTGECAGSGGDLKGVALVERPLVLRLAVRLAVEAAAAALLAGLVLAAGSLGVRTDLGTFTIGLLAAVALVGMVAVLAGRAGSRDA